MLTKIAQYCARRGKPAALVVVVLAGSSGCIEALDDSDSDQPLELNASEAESPSSARAGDAAANPPFASRDAGIDRPRDLPPGAATDSGVTRPDGAVDWPQPPGAVRDAGRGPIGEVCAPSGPTDAGHPMLFCTGRVFGDGKTCASFDLLRQLAVAACSADGLTLMEMEIGDECEGGATTGWASCCSTYTPAPPDAGVGGQAGCTGIALGGRQVCTSALELRQIAYDACEAQGLVLLNLTVGTPCAGGALDARGSCCPVDGMPVPADDPLYAVE